MSKTGETTHVCASFAAGTSRRKRVVPDHDARADLEELRHRCAELVRRCRARPEMPARDLTAALESLQSAMEELSRRDGGEDDDASDRDRLRSLSMQLVLVEEAERRRLATELHDGLCQSIALARLRYAELRRSADDALGRSLEEIAALIERADRSARSITFELSPPILHHLGLVPALEWLVENIRERYGLPVTLEDDAQPKPADETTRVILFRAIRELLINAAKHSRASAVRLRLERRPDGLAASVADDGVGMDGPVPGARAGFGLLSVQEHMRHVGGSLRVESAPGRGTTAHLFLPLAEGP